MSYNTDNADIRTFRPHGRVEFSAISNNTVLYKCFGPFNSEVISALKVVHEEVLKNYPHRKEIVLFENSCVGIEELLVALTKYLQELKLQDVAPTATVFVISPEIEGKCLMANKYKKCYQVSGIPFIEVETIEEAQSWLEQFNE